MLLQLAKVAVACSSGVSWLESNSDKLALVMRESMLDASKPWLRCLRQVSDSIGNLTGLVVTLNLSGNLYLERLPIRALCNLRSLKGLDCKSCPKLLSPPPQICALPPDQTLKFLRDAMAGGRLHTGCVIFVIGASSAGKTSLISALTKRGAHAKAAPNQPRSHFARSGVPALDTVGMGMKKQLRVEPTVGASATTWTADGGITLLLVELGGHAAFLDAYRSFLSRRAIYVLCWDAESEAKAPGQATQLSTLTHWLAILQNRVPGVPVMLVATHSGELPTPALAAQVDRVRLAAAEKMLELVHPDGPRSIEILEGGVSSAVDSVSGAGVEQLRGRLLAQVRKTRWFEEAVPREFVKLEWSVRLRAHSSPCISREEFHELCTTAGISPDLVDWVTRWLHDALEIRDLGSGDIWVSVPWMAAVVNEALRPNRTRLRAFISRARRSGDKWADQMDGQLRRLQVMGRLHRHLLPFIWDARSQEPAPSDSRTDLALPSPAAFWQPSQHRSGPGPQSPSSPGGFDELESPMAGTFDSASPYGGGSYSMGRVVDLATVGRHGSKWTVAQQELKQGGSLMHLVGIEHLKEFDAWTAGPALLRTDKRAFAHAEQLLKHMGLLSDSGPLELAGPMLGGQYRRLVIEAGALSLRDCQLWARYRFLSVPPGFLRAVVVRLQALTLHCETNLFGAALYTDGRMMQVFESMDGKSITVRAATEIGLDIAAKEVEDALDRFPGVVLLGKDSGPKDVVLPVQLVMITTAAVGWKQFREEVARPRLRDDILADFWDSTAGDGGKGVRNTLCRMIMQESGGEGLNRQLLDVEMYGKFVRFTGPARVAVLLLSGDMGALFDSDPELRKRLAQVRAEGGGIIALWLPDCQVDDHREWWPTSMSGVLDWNTPYVDLRNKVTWPEKVQGELIPLVYKLLKLWRGSPGVHGRMVKCPECRPLGLVTGQFPVDKLEDQVREWRLHRTSAPPPPPTQTCARGHQHDTLEILQGEGGSASLRCDAVACPLCLAEGALPPGCFDVWQSVAPYYRGEVVAGKGLLRCSRCTMRSRLFDAAPPQVFIAFASGARGPQMDQIARSVLRRLEEEAGTVSCLGGGLELIGSKPLEGVRKASMLLLLLTDDFVTSRQCMAELSEALAMHKPVVPVLLRPSIQPVQRRNSILISEAHTTPAWAGWSAPATEDWWKHAEALTGSNLSPHEDHTTAREPTTFRNVQSAMPSHRTGGLHSRDRESDVNRNVRTWRALAEREVDPLVMHVGADARGDVAPNSSDCDAIVTAVVDTLLSAPWPELPQVGGDPFGRAASGHAELASPLSLARSRLTSGSVDGENQSMSGSVGQRTVLNVGSPLASVLPTRRILSERSDEAHGISKLPPSAARNADRRYSQANSWAP